MSSFELEKRNNDWKTLLIENPPFNENEIFSFISFSFLRNRNILLHQFSFWISQSNLFVLMSATQIITSNARYFSCYSMTLLIGFRVDSSYSPESTSRNFRQHYESNKLAYQELKRHCSSQKL